MLLAHLFLNRVAVFATRNEVMSHDWIVEQAAFVFNVSPQHWAMGVLVETFQEGKFTLSCPAWNKLCWWFFNNGRMSLHNDLAQCLVSLAIADLHITSARLPSPQLTLLNQIRLRLHVISVSDIVTPDGRQVTPQAFACKTGDALCNDLQWPWSIPMCARHQRLWQQTLQMALLDSASGGWLIRPAQQLCRWFSLPTWPWRFSPTSSAIHRCVSPKAGWTEFQPVHTRARTSCCCACLCHLTIPPEGPLLPASVTCNPDQTFLLVNTGPLLTSPAPADSFRDPPFPLLTNTHSATVVTLQFPTHESSWIGSCAFRSSMPRFPPSPSQLTGGGQKGINRSMV